MADRASGSSSKLHAIQPILRGAAQTPQPRTFYESRPKKMPTRGKRRQRTPSNKGTAGDAASVVVGVVRRAVVAVRHPVVVGVVPAARIAVVAAVAILPAHGRVDVAGAVAHVVARDPGIAAMAPVPVPR